MMARLLLLFLAPIIGRAAGDAATVAAVGTSLRDCFFTTPGGTFDLASLGTVFASSSRENPEFSYAFNACANILPGRASAACSGSAPAPALQATPGACHALGRLEERSIAPLKDGLVGMVVAFAGGDSCGASISRSLTVEVVCADAIVPLNAAVVENTTRSCTYHGRVEARSGCPLECARDPVARSVCGGMGRGVCTAARSGGPATCVCKEGYVLPHCAPVRSDAQLNAATARKAADVGTKPRQFGTLTSAARVERAISVSTAEKATATPFSAAIVGAGALAVLFWVILRPRTRRVMWLTAFTFVAIFLPLLLQIQPSAAIGRSSILCAPSSLQATVQRVSAVAPPRTDPPSSGRAVAVMTTALASGCMQGSLGLSNYNKRVYAELNGYDFVPHRPVEGAAHLDISWMKIDAIAERLNRHRWVVWMDLDVVVANFSARVEDIILLQPPSAHFIVAHPPGDEMLNAGMFFIRGSAWSRGFIARLRAHTDTFTVGYLEQEAIRREVRGDPHAVVLQGDTLFNSLCGDNDCHLPPTGGFTMHFAPPRCPLKLVLASALDAVFAAPAPFAPLIVSGASAGISDAAVLQLLDSVHLAHPKQRVLFFDFGLSELQRTSIAAHPAVLSVRRLDASSVTAAATETGDNGQSDAWAPLALEAALEEHEMVLWLDVGSSVCTPLARLWSVIAEDGVFLASANSGLKLAEAALLETLAHFAAVGNVSGTQPLCSGSPVGFMRHSSAHEDILQPWAACVRKRGHCAAPRQVQAALSVLAAAHGYLCGSLPQETEINIDVDFATGA